MKQFLLVLIIGLASCDVSTKDQKSFYEQFVSFDFGVESGFISQPYLQGQGNTFFQLVFKVGQNYSTVTPDDPVIIWLNGGPGCASQFGFYGEIGPFVITNSTDATKKYDINIRNSSWNKQAHLLFIDQPFGVGFSYTDQKDLVNNTDDSAHYLHETIKQFYQHYTKLQNNSLYIFGESFAGHYIPAVSAKILADPVLNQIFKGVGIGDGWTSPINQIAPYSGFLYAAGLVDDLRRNYAQKLSTTAQSSILQGQWGNASDAFEQLSGGLLTQYTGQISPYNFRTYIDPNDKSTDPIDAFLYDHRTQFYDSPQSFYNDCNNAVYVAFKDDICTSRESDVIALLNAGKRVLLYNGQLDYIVNTAGALLWINQMKWDKIENWKQQPKGLFKLNGDVKGWYKKYGQFTFANIYQAGHMVPSDQPDSAFSMLQHYLNNDDVWE